MLAQETIMMERSTDVFWAIELAELRHFPKRTEPLALLERQPPKEAAEFFQKVMQTPFRLTGDVHRDRAGPDIRAIIMDMLAIDIQNDPFFDYWISDMSNICRSVCDVIGADSVNVWLGTERSCRRYHVDNVSLRTLVTYAGVGTEYLPNVAADRKAYKNGASNEEIVKDSSAIRMMTLWDVAVFRGGPAGLLHKTPDAALADSSVFMRIDPVQ